MQYLQKSTLIACLAAISTSYGQASFNDDSEIFNLSLSQLMSIPVSAASLFDEPTQHAAAHIRTLSTKDWQSFSDRHIYDSLQFNSGINAYPTLFGGHALAIRGYSNFLSVRGISTLIDGVPVNDILFGSASYDNQHISLGVLDSLEIIKGPGSTLYGTDAFHGVLSFNLFDRDSEFTQFSSQVGSDGFNSALLQVSRPIKSAFVNIAVDQRQLTHYAWPYTNRAQNTATPFSDERDTQYTNQSLSLKIHNTSSSPWSYSASYFLNQFDGENFLGGGDSFNYLNQDISNSKHSLNLLSTDVAYQLNSMTQLGVKSSYWQVDRDNLFEVASGQVNQEQTIQREQAQFYLKYSNPEVARLYLAGDYSSQSITKANSNGVSQAEQGLMRDIKSIFAQGRVFNGFYKTDIELGFRLDDYDDFGVQATPRFSLIHKLSEQQTIKLLYANSFRAAVALELVGSNSIKGNSDIEPETLDSYEISWLGNQDDYAFEATLFFTQWENAIISIPIIDPVYDSEFTNTGNNESRGIELMLSKTFPLLSATTQYSYIESENLKLNADYVAFPRHNLSLSTKSLFSSFHQVESRVLFRDTWKTSNNTQALKHYLRLDVSYRYTSNTNWHVNTSIKNILDSNNVTPSLLGRGEGDEDIPLTFDVSVTFEF